MSKVGFEELTEEDIKFAIEAAKKHSGEAGAAAELALVNLTEEVNIDLVFGKALGIGVQALLTTNNLQFAMLQSFLAWNADLYDEAPKKKKSFWYCVNALRRFQASVMPELRGKWKVFEYGSKQAVELSFRLHLGEGFTYRGFIDVVLQNEETGQLLVVELKTTAMKFVHEAMYKNSDQGLGYLLFLDKIFAKMTQLEVLYLVYKSTVEEFEPFKFPKDMLVRAKWIRDLFTTVAILKFYAQVGEDFPMHGNSCFSHFKPCNYFDLCQMSNAALLPPVAKIPVEDAMGPADFELDIKEFL